MKRMYGVLVGIFLLVLLGGCNDPPVEIPDEKEPVDLTAEEILQKSSVANKNINSMAAVVEVELSNQEQSTDIVYEITLVSELELLFEPTNTNDVVGIHELTNRKHRTLFEHGDEEIEEYSFEQYKSSEGLFRKYQDFDTWSKLQDREYDGITDSLISLMNPRLDVSIFNSYVDDFTIDENNDAYYLKISGVDDKFKQLLLEVLLRQGYTKESLPGNEKQLESIKIHTFDVEITIDKETFYTNAFKIEVDFEIEIIYEEYNEIQHITENVQVALSNINQLDNIEIPQHIIDTAEDVDW